MKKVLLLLLVFLTTLLVACSADMIEDPSIEDDYGLSLIMSYDYQTGTFNNAPNQSYITGFHNYGKEFFAWYDKAMSQGYIDSDLTMEQITAYQTFFDKLELLDDHDAAIFELDSSGITELLEQHSIDVTPLDIFTFNAIKNTFSEVNYRTITLRTPGFLEVLLDRSFTTAEQDGYTLLVTIREEFYYENYEPLPVMTYQDTVDFITSSDEITLSDTETQDLQAFFLILEELQNN